MTDEMYASAFFWVGMGAILAALLIFARVIPHMALTHKWHASFLWLFVVGLGSLGVAIVFERIGHPSGRTLFLVADASLVLGALGVGASWEVRRIAQKKRGRFNENN